MDLIERIFYNLTQVHPFHTLLVHFPIALLGAALFFILLALVWRKNKGIEPIAFANLALAAVSTLAAGISGMLDNNDIYSGQAPNHQAKIILAIVLFIITTLTVILRWRNPNLFQSRGRTLYIAAYVVSFSIVSVLAFLGGVILYGF